MIQLFDAIQRLGRTKFVLAIKITIFPLIKCGTGRGSRWRPSCDFFPAHRRLKGAGSNPLDYIFALCIKRKPVSLMKCTHSGVVVELLKNLPLAGHHHFRDEAGSPGFSDECPSAGIRRT